MAAPPRPPAPSEHHAWIDTWIAPPDREGTRKLLDVLSSVTDASPYLTRVKRLVVDGPLRDELGISLYDETVWGVIRWHRAIGRPVTPTLAAGFSILHQYDLSFKDTVTGRTFGGWVDAGQPQIWDGPDDTETHAVSFMLHGVAQWTNRVIVGLAQGVEWPIESEVRTVHRNCGARRNPRWRMAGFKRVQVCDPNGQPLGTRQSHAGLTIRPPNHFTRGFQEFVQPF